MDAFRDLRGGFNLRDNLVHTFVGHGRLIQGIRNDTGGVNIPHPFPVLLHGGDVKGLGSMKSGQPFVNLFGQFIQ